MYKKRSLFGMIFLTIVTFGVYYIYWCYVTTRDINQYLEVKDMEAEVELLLIIFLFIPYIFYWYYKYGNRINDARYKARLPEKKIAIVCLLLSIIGLGYISALIMQYHINKIYKTMEV